MKKGGSSRWLKIMGIAGGAVLIIVIVALLIGGRESPADVALAFYRAGNEGNYAKAYGYLTPEVQMAWEMMESFLFPRFDNAMDAATKGGTITRIEVKKGMEYAGFATVSLTLDYKDGSREEDLLTLNKLSGRWRIYVSTLLLIPSFP